MKILTSAEDYLETIFVIGKNKNNVRASDIVKHTGFSRASVSIALKQLKENGYIAPDKGYDIVLTDKGTEIAKKVYERHMLIAQFLIAVGVDEKTAYEDACKLEHVISEKSFQCLSEHYSRNLSSAALYPASSRQKSNSGFCRNESSI